MAPTPASSDLSQFPPDLVRAVTEGAARDAELAGHLLHAVGLAPPRGQVRALPEGFLLDLGAAMRLLAWEHAGLAVHREAGLPPALEAAAQVFLDAVPSEAGRRWPDRWLCKAVLRLAVDRLAWAGPRDLQAEVLLDFPDEDALVEAMARFLWDHRRPPPSVDWGGTP